MVLRFRCYVEGCEIWCCVDGCSGGAALVVVSFGPSCSCFSARSFKVWAHCDNHILNAAVFGAALKITAIHRHVLPFNVFNYVQPYPGIHPVEFQRSTGGTSIVAMLPRLFRREGRDNQ